MLLSSIYEGKVKSVREMPPDKQQWYEEIRGFPPPRDQFGWWMGNFIEHKAFPKIITV